MDLTDKITKRLDLLKRERDKLNKEIEEMDKLLEIQKDVETRLNNHFEETVKASSFKSVDKLVIEPTPLTTEEKESLTEGDVEEIPSYVAAEKDKRTQIEIIVERSREGLKDNLKSNLPISPNEDTYKMHDYWKNLIETKNSPYRKLDDCWIKHRPGGVNVIRLVDGLYTESRYRTGEVYHTKNKVIKEQPKHTPPVNYEWE